MVTASADHNPACIRLPLDEFCPADEAVRIAQEALDEAFGAALASTVDEAIAIPNPMQLTPSLPVDTVASAGRSSGDVEIQVDGVDERVDEWFSLARQYESDGFVCPIAIFQRVNPEGFVRELFRGEPTRCASGNVLWYRNYPGTAGSRVAYFPNNELLCNTWTARDFDVFAGRPCIEIQND